MAKKKISIRTLDKIAAESGQDQIELEWYGEQLIIDSMLSFGEAVLFIDSVVNACMDQNTGAYRPELYDFSLRSATVALYTNVSIPENAEHQYYLLYKTDLVDTVRKCINQDQYEDMLHAIGRKLRYMLDVNQNYLAKKVEDTARSVEKAAGDLAAIFADVTPEDIKKITQAFGDGYNEEKLVRALMNNLNESREEQNSPDAEGSGGE